MAQIVSHRATSPDRGGETVEAVPTVAGAIAAFEAAAAGADPYRDARAGVARELATARERVERRVALATSLP